MATLEDVATRVLADLSIDGHLLLATQWAHDQYVDLLGDIKLNQARQLGTLTVPANLTTGTVSVTQNGSIVTGDATAQTAWASLTLIGWHIRCANNWYKIAGQSSSTLTLATSYTEDTVSAGTYVARKREFELPTDVKRLGTFSHSRLHLQFEVQSLASIITEDPSRVIITSGPYKAADLMTAPSGAKVIELYPGSSQAETIDYIYWTTPDAVSAKDPLPGTIDPAHLVEGVKIRAYEWLAAKAAQTDKLELAAFYQNNSARQRTIWIAIKRSLIRQDGVMDDTTFLLSRAQPSAIRDIRTARDHVYATPLT